MEKKTSWTLKFAVGTMTLGILGIIFTLLQGDFFEKTEILEGVIEDVGPSYVLFEGEEEMHFEDIVGSIEVIDSESGEYIAVEDVNKETSRYLSFVGILSESGKRKSFYSLDLTGLNAKLELERTRKNGGLTFSVTSAKLYVNLGEVLENKDKNYRANHFFFDVTKTEYNSNEKPSYSLHVELNYPTNTKKDIILAVRDLKAGIKKLEEAKSSGADIYTIEAFETILENNSFVIFEELEGNRFKRISDGLIVDKQYLERYAYVLGENDRKVETKFEDEELLFDVAKFFERFEKEIE